MRLNWAAICTSLFFVSYKVSSADHCSKMADSGSQALTPQPCFASLHKRESSEFLWGLPPYGDPWYEDSAQKCVYHIFSLGYYSLVYGCVVWQRELELIPISLTRLITLTSWRVSACPLESKIRADEQIGSGLGWLSSLSRSEGLFPQGMEDHSHSVLPRLRCSEETGESTLNSCSLTTFYFLASVSRCL